MKKDKLLKAQSIVLFVFLACAAFVFVYSLGFMTKFYPFSMYGDSIHFEFFYKMQKVNNQIMLLGVFSIIVSVICFYIEINKSKPGPITTGIAGVLGLGIVGFAVYSIFGLMGDKAEYLTLGTNQELTEFIGYTISTFTFDLGMGIIVLLAISAITLPTIVLINFLKTRKELSMGVEK